MDPVEVVMGALGAGLSGTVTQAVQDAYAGLREVLLRRLRGDSQAVSTLEAQVAEPDALRVAVVESGLAADEQVLAAAGRVLQAAGATVGKYVIDIGDAKGVQIGDNSTMTINF